MAALPKHRKKLPPIGQCSTWEYMVHPAGDCTLWDCGAEYCIHYNYLNQLANNSEWGDQDYVFWTDCADGSCLGIQWQYGGYWTWCTYFGDMGGGYETYENCFQCGLLDFEEMWEECTDWSECTGDYCVPDCWFDHLSLYVGFAMYTSCNTSADCTGQWDNILYECWAGCCYDFGT